MVELKEISKGSKKYFYLVQSFREGKSVKKKQTYLGEIIPKDIENKKAEFMREFYKEKFLDEIDRIKENFEKEYKIMPISARKKSKDIFAIKFTYNTQRIEGSTLSLKDTAQLLEEGLTPSARPIDDVKETGSHKIVFEDMMECEKDLSMQMVLKWNKKLLEETKPDIAGKIRNYQVAIAQSKFTPPLAIEIESLLYDFFKWYNQNKSKLHPVELATLVHLKFVTIHPFGDGNGRISRLMMNFILKRNRFPLLDIPYTKRDSYYNALERSQVNRDDNIFIQWIFRRYLAEYKRYLNRKS
ncbi:MAG: Fic family protein [Candidatus Pacearchaeota archaeon]